MPKIVSCQVTPVWFVEKWIHDGENQCLPPSEYRPCDWVSHKNDVTSEFKCKFYKDSGSPNLAMMAKFQFIRSSKLEAAHNWWGPFLMEPPTMLLVPIRRDMQLWWDKPPIPSPRKCMPSETCFDDVGRICACVTWTQMYVTLQTKKCFPFKSSH